jgi:uncharacterized damage-inducible protein DinB
MNEGLSMIGKMFKTNGQWFERAVQGIPMDKWKTRPGADSNPLVWIVGHVTVSRAYALKTLGGEWSAPWEQMFVRGAKMLPPEEYPAPEEIQRAWSEVSEKLTAVLPAASPEFLAKETPKGSPSLDGTVKGLLNFLCLHETYHMGQLGYVRKSLGYGQTVG